MVDLVKKLKSFRTESLDPRSEEFSKVSDRFNGILLKSEARMEKHKELHGSIPPLMVDNYQSLFDAAILLDLYAEDLKKIYTHWEERGKQGTIDL